MILPPLGKATAVFDEQLQVDEVDKDEEAADDEKVPGREARMPSPVTQWVRYIVSYSYIGNLCTILFVVQTL